jgi:hypothetical protein
MSSQGTICGPCGLRNPSSFFYQKEAADSWRWLKAEGRPSRPVWEAYWEMPNTAKGKLLMRWIDFEVFCQEETSYPLFPSSKPSQPLWTALWIVKTLVTRNADMDKVRTFLQEDQVPYLGKDSEILEWAPEDFGVWGFSEGDPLGPIRRPDVELEEARPSPIVSSYRYAEFYLFRL